MSIQALRERKQHVAREANALLADNGDQVWSEADQKKYKDLMDQLGRVNDQIKAYQEMLDAEADTIINDSERAGGKPKTDSAHAKARVALANYLGKDPSALNADETAEIRNAMSTTTPSEGGYTVQPLVAPEVIDFLKAFGGMRECSQVVTMDSGADLSYPSSDGTGDTGEWVAQNAPAGSGDINFNGVPLNVHKSSSRKIALPWELIADSGIDVVAFVLNRLLQRLARTHNAGYTNGDGNGKPFGIVPRSTVGKVGVTGQTTSVVYKDLVDLKHSVNQAYRKNARWSMADSSVRVLSSLVDTNGRPIFTPGYEFGITEDTPDLLLGKPITVNDDVPVMAANAKSILFGDHKQYVIRDVAGLLVRRFDDSAFALLGQVGFCAWQRTGGNLMDTGAVKAYQNSAT